MLRHFHSSLPDYLFAINILCFQKILAKVYDELIEINNNLVAKNGPVGRNGLMRNDFI